MSDIIQELKKLIESAEDSEKTWQELNELRQKYAKLEQECKRLELELFHAQATIKAGWMPIESAPKGERVLVIYSCGDEPFIAEQNRYGEWHADASHLYADDGVIDAWMRSNPVAWMPLPQVPDKTK